MFYSYTVRRWPLRFLRISLLLLLLVLPEGPLFAAPPVEDFQGRFAGTKVPNETSAQETIVARLQARYDETDGFRADFVQEITSATLGQTLRSRGQVFFKKPGRMRWEFTEPQQLLIADGSALWLYQPAERQVVKTPFQHAFSSQTPVSFLTGVGRLEEDFSVLPQGETSSVYQLRLTPKQAAEAIGLLDIEVSKETFDILQALVTDPLGNTTRVSFTNIERETALGDDLFRFELPPGIDLVEPLPDL